VNIYLIFTLSGWKGLNKFIPRDSLNSPLIYILFSLIISDCGFSSKVTYGYLLSELITFMLEKRQYFPHYDQKNVQIGSAVNWD